MEQALPTAALNMAPTPLTLSQKREQKKAGTAAGVKTPRTRMNQLQAFTTSVSLNTD